MGKKKEKILIPRLVKSQKRTAESVAILVVKPPKAPERIPIRIIKPKKRISGLLNKKNLPIFLGVISVISIVAIVPFVVSFLNSQTAEKEIDKNAILSSRDVSLIQASPIAINKPIKWVALIKKSSIKDELHFLQLPKNAKDIKVQVLSKDEVEDLISNAKIESKKKLTLNDVLINKNKPSNILARINSFLFADLEQAVVEIAENITGDQDIIQTEEAVFVDVSEEALPQEQDLRQLVEENPLVQEQTETQEPTISDANQEVSSLELEEDKEEQEQVSNLEIASSNDVVTPSEVVASGEEEDYVAVEYTTEDNVLITEEDTNTGKIVKVSTQDEQSAPTGSNDVFQSQTSLTLTNVLAYTAIPEIYKVGQEDKIKISWKNNDDQLVEFHAYDTNNNGKLDYVEWTVPHLSEQIFEIIFISKAFKLDADKNIIADVYDQTRYLDNNWIDLNDGQYIRATFDRVLDNTKDNTIYAKPTEINNPASIEVYPVYSDAEGNMYEGPLVATFSSIDHEGLYKILLTDLQEPTSVFDLKIIGDVDIDYIVDPSTACSWKTDAADTAWGTASNWDCAAVPNSDSYVVTIPAGATNWPVTSGALTIGDLTIDVSAQMTLAGILTVQDNSGVSTTGSATVNGTLYVAGYAVNAHGDITVNGTVSSTGAVTLYADNDNSTAGTFTMGASGAVTGGAATIAIDGVGTQVLNTITNSGAFNITINANRKPSSVAINGVISNSNTGATRTLTIYSNGDITQVGDLGLTSYNFGAVYLYIDQDNSGATTFTHTSGTIFSTYTYIEPKAGTILTFAGLTFTGTSALTAAYIGLTTVPTSVTLTATVTGTGGASGAQFKIYSNTDITQNANISLTQDLYYYPDYDASGDGQYIYTSGTIACRIESILQTTAMVLSNGASLATGGSWINIGSSTVTPASVTINGTVSTTNVYIYSKTDITQAAAIIGTGNIFILPDYDNTGDGQFISSYGTIRGITSLRQTSAVNLTTGFTVRNAADTANTTFYIGDSTPRPNSITIATNITANVMHLYSNGNITQNGNLNTGTAGDITLYPDYDNTGDGQFVYTSGTITSRFLNITQVSAIVLNGGFAASTAYPGITIGAAASKPASVTINGSISSSGTSTLYGITVNSNGDINIGASLTSGTGGVSFITLNPGASNKTYITADATLTGNIFTNNGALTVNSGVTLASVFTTASITSDLTVIGILAGSRAVTLSGASKTIYGSGTVSAPVTLSASYAIDSTANITFSATTTINAGITLTNNGILTTSSLSGSGAFTQGASSTLNYSGTSIAATFTASASNNTVNYSKSGAQTIYGPLTYFNLSISGTDTKSLAGAIVISGNLTIGSGTALDVTGSNYAISVAGNWSNSGTFTARSGTVTFNGTGTQALNSGGSSFYNITFSGAGTLQPTTNDITVTGALTFNAGAGTFDNATNDRAITVSGNVTMDNTTTTLGDAIFSIGGDFDFEHVTTFTANLSEIKMSGTSKSLIPKSNGYFYKLTIDAGASITQTKNNLNFDNLVSGHAVLTVNGTYTIASGATDTPRRGASVDINAGGVLTGVGTLYFLTSDQLVDGLTTLAGTLSIDNVTIQYPYLNTWAGGTWDVDNVIVIGDTSNSYFNFNSTNYIFNGNLTFRATSSNGANHRIYTNLYATPPNITIKGNLIFDIDGSNNITFYNNGKAANWTVEGDVIDQDTGAGSLVWTKGTGTITLSGGNAQAVDFDIGGVNPSYEGIVVNKTAGTTATLGGNLTTDSLTLTSGTFTEGANTVTLRGNMLVTSGAFTKNASGNVVFGAGNANQTLTSNGIDIGNIQVSANTTATTLTLQDNLNADNITIDASQTLTADDTEADRDVTCGGNWTTAGTFTPATATVTFDGTAQTINSATTFYHLIVLSSTQLDINSVTVNAYDLTVGSSTDMNPVLRLDNASDALTLTYTGYNYGTINQSAGTMRANAGVDTAKFTNYYTDATHYGTYSISGGTLITVNGFDNRSAFNISGASTVVNMGYYFHNRSPGITTITDGTVNAYNTVLYGSTVVQDGGTFSAGLQDNYGSFTDNGASTGIWQGNSGLIKFATGSATGIYLRTTGIYFNNVEIYMNSSINTSTTQTLDVRGNFTINATKTFTTNNKNITVAGNWANSGTFTAGTGTVTFDAGSGTQTLDNGSSSFYSVTHSGSGTLQLATNHLTLSNGATLTNSAGILDASTNSKNITVGTSGATSALSVSGGTLQLGTVDLTVYGNSTATGGTVTVGASSNTGWTTTDMTIGASGVVTCSGASKINVSGNWNSSAGTFTPDTGTVTFNGTAQTIQNATTFYHLTISSSTQLDVASVSVGVYDLAITAGGTLRMDNASDSLTASSAVAPAINNLGTIIISDGNLVCSGAPGGYPITFANGSSSSHTASIQQTGGAITGSGSAQIHNYATYDISAGTIGTWAYYVTTTGGTTNISGTASIVSGYFQDSAGTVNMSGGTVTGFFPNYGGTFNHTGGTFNAGYYIDNGSGSYYGSDSALFKLTGSAFKITKAGSYFNDVEISGNSSIHADTTQILDIRRNFTINATKTFTTNNKNISVSGNWTNNGTLTAGTSTVTLNGTSQKIFGNNTFYNLTKDVSAGSADTLHFQQSNTQTIAANGTLTLTGGSGKVLTLRGCDASGNLTAGDPKWGLAVNASGTTLNVDYIDVKDSDASAGKEITLVSIPNSTNSGNNLNWLFDAVAPTTTPSATSNGSPYTFDTWTGYSVSVTLSCADNDGGTGCAAGYPKYCVDTANTCDPVTAGTSYTVPVSISTENTSYIRYYSADTVPNTETVKSSTIKIDTTAPSGGSVSYTNGYFTTTSVDITYTTGTDGASGLATATGKLQRASADLSNGTCGDFTAFSDLVTEFDGSHTDTTVTTAKCYKYQYLIQDTLSNQATYTSVNVAKIDTSVPTTSDDFTHHNTWQTSNQTITLTPTDATSGVAWTKYCTDALDTCNPSSGTSYTDPVQITSEGLTYFRYASQDNAGNTQTTVSKIVLIDKTNPSTTANGNGYTFGTWTSSNVLVTLSCVDSVSGCGATVYCTDSENTCTPTTPYTSGVTISTSDISYIRYYSVDTATNPETAQSSQIKINRVPTISSAPSDGSSSATTPTNVGNNVTFTATATDSDSLADNYYLAICKTDSITANNNAAPTCGGESWCVSGSTSSGSEASCSYTSLIGDNESNDWFAFVCDYDANSQCSAYSQGAGDSGSPFKVNHSPIFSSSSTSPDLAGLGSSINFLSTSSDSDTDTNADTITLYVCKSNDFTGTTCGSGGEWCHSSAGSSNLSCSYTVLADDGNSSHNYYTYILDSHNLQSSSNPRSGTFNTDVVPPVVSNFTPTLGSISTLPTSTSFTLNEIGYCRYSTSDQSYSQMTSDCSGGGTTSITCEVPHTNESSMTFFISCQDVLGNSNSSSDNNSIDYHLSVIGSGNPGGSPVVETVQQTIQQAVENVVQIIQDIPEQVVQIPEIVVEKTVDVVETVTKVADLIKPELKEEKITYPPIEESVTEKTPLVFQNTTNLLSLAKLGTFINTPLPQGIQSLTAKFPKLDTALNTLGIAKMADAGQIAVTSFNLPSLSDLVPKLNTGLALADISQSEKQIIPTEIVFANMASERISLSNKVSITSKGNPVQSINVMQNHELTLSVKPEYSAKSVLGYMIFKGKTDSVSVTPESPKVVLIPTSAFSASLTQPMTNQVVDSSEIKKDFVVDQFPYEDSDGDGIYTAKIITPMVVADYEIKTVIEYEDQNNGSKEISMIALIDPEGYVFRKISGGEESRIKGAEVSLYWLNPETKEYEFWSAKEFLQDNPQTTDGSGKYSFLVPEGSYYLKVEHPLYAVWQSKPFLVQQGTGIHMNVELKSKNWVLAMFSPESLLIAGTLFLLSITIMTSAVVVSLGMQRRRLNSLKRT